MSGAPHGIQCSKSASFGIIGTWRVPAPSPPRTAVFLDASRDAGRTLTAMATLRHYLLILGYVLRAKKIAPNHRY